MYQILTCISLLSVLIACVFGIISYNYNGIFLRAIFYMTFFSLVVEVTGETLGIMYRSNIWLFNLYLLPNTLLTGIAGTYLFNKVLNKYLIRIGLLIWSIFWFIQLYTNGIAIFANRAFLFGGLLLIVVYLVSLKNLFVSTTVFYKQPEFWVAIAVIVYYACNIPSFGLINYLISHHDFAATNLYYINNILSIFYYSLISYSFYLCRKQAMSLVSKNL